MAEASSSSANLPGHPSDAAGALAGDMGKLTITTPKSSESTCLSPRPRRSRREGEPGIRERRRNGTPTRRLPISGRLSGRTLFSHPPRTAPPRWSDDESRKLVQYILQKGNGSWVLCKDRGFWDNAARFIQQSLGTSHLRSGNACRSKTLKLKEQYRSPTEAYPDTPGDTPGIHSSPEGSGPGSQESTSSLMQVSPPESGPVTPTQFSPHEECSKGLAALQPVEKLTVLTKLFNDICNRRMETDFLQLAFNAMQNLKNNGRSNLVYQLCKCVGTMRSDMSDSLLPVKRMPTGLIEYILNFYSAQTAKKVVCPTDYRLWQQSMYALFGTKWTKLHGGPMWCIDPTGQEGTTTADNKTFKPTEARCNIPSLSDRTLRRDVVASGFTKGSEVQTTVLDQAMAAFPASTNWWIKGDAVDLVAGLGESVKGEWAGDVDLGDGSLQEMFKEYQRRLQMIAKIGLKDRRETNLMVVDLKQEFSLLGSDLEFLLERQQIATKAYEKAKEKRTQPEKALFSLAWQLEELHNLCEGSRTLRAEINVMIDLLSNPDTNCQRLNLPLRLSKLRERLRLSAKAASKYRRKAATHAFVFMISPETRTQKPYALPVRCVPNKSLKASELRCLTQEIVEEMKKRGMNVVGPVSNGEFNTLRARGYSRPVSILQVRADVRAKYAKIKHGVLKSMLSPLQLPDGTLVAEHPNCAVPESLLKEIWEWHQSGASHSDILSRLRVRTVPQGYTFSPWNPGRTESEADMMRSILAQLEYKYEICRYDSLGIPFCQHMYVPETNSVTYRSYHEREDEAHVLKRIATSTREGGPTNMHLERFVEALSDPSSNLTYYALCGARKQSVQDAERLLSPEVAEFMDKKGYMTEAVYIRAIANWRRSCDERGLSELQRCRYNYQLLNYILNDLMPWHTQFYDFSLLEVNRPVTRVCGFTRETLIALTTNIESREWRRVEIANAGLRPEHPRASSTDDVECFFSCLRDGIGKNFTLKEVQVNFRKVCMEFTKRIDPSLPFFYYTSAHHRYHEGELPEFNEAGNSKRKSRLKRVPQREQIATLVPGRVTLPVRGSLSVRPQFHNQPLELPPPPSAPLHLFEHAYAHH